MDSLSLQLYAFAITLLAGASFGLIFDSYRLLRSWLRPGAIATAVMDLFFWVIGAPVLTIYILIANWGELRFYVLIGIILGLAFYYLLFSRLIIKLISGICNIIGRVISCIIQFGYLIVIWPIRFIQDISLVIPTKRFGRKLRWQSPWFAIFKRR